MQTALKNLGLRISRTNLQSFHNLPRHRWFSIDIDDILTPEQKQKHKSITSNLKKIIRAVHPDVHVNSNPSVAKVNEIALTEINNFFSALEDYLVKLNRKAFEKLDSPVKINFIHRHPETKELKPVKTNLYLPMHLFTQETHSPYHILTYYEECVKTLENAINPPPPQKRRKYK